MFNVTAFNDPVTDINVRKISGTFAAVPLKALSGLFFTLLFCIYSLNAQNLKSISFTEPSQHATLHQGSALSLGEYIYTTDNNPVRAVLTAIDTNKNLPHWLLVNEKVINGISYTTNSEISISYDATDLSTGEYSAVVTAAAPGYTSALLTIFLSVTTDSSDALLNTKVNQDLLNEIKQK